MEVMVTFWKQRRQRAFVSSFCIVSQYLEFHPGFECWIVYTGLWKVKTTHVWTSNRVATAAVTVAFGLHARSGVSVLDWVRDEWRCFRNVKETRRGSLGWMWWALKTEWLLATFFCCFFVDKALVLTTYQSNNISFYCLNDLYLGHTPHMFMLT